MPALRVQIPQVLVVESDKADMDVESYEEGYIAKILVGEARPGLSIRTTKYGLHFVPVPQLQWS